MIPFHFSSALALSLAVALGGALRPGATLAELNVVDPGRGFPRVSRSYAELGATFAREGAVRSDARVDRIRLGSTRAEVTRAIGRPVSAFRDGSWNYNLSLDYPQRTRLVCQYRVYFDDNGHVTETVWRRPQCSAAIGGQGG